MATEKRLIDANALMDTLKKRTTTAYPNELWGLMLAQDFVEDALTVDAVEVVHGQWEKAEYNGFLRCDQCKDVYINEEWLEDGKWNYCPNCGAKMDGERKDNGKTKNV